MEVKIDYKRRFRPEIEGLRAVAALLVAVYHIWLGNVSGGVDVFFIVSGFLITTSLLGRMERTGRIEVLSFLLGLAKRLFPAAFFVLFIVTIASILWLPQVRWDQTVQEILASALYFQNWQLAFNAVDYLAQDNEASPVQHYWAMSIQGQFYIIWPIVVFGLAALVSRVFRKSFALCLAIVLACVFFASLAYSVYRTSFDQAWAYFDTFTRVWEFSLGGLTAVLGSQIVLRRQVSVVIGWIGLLAIVSCGLIFQVATVFPGYAALWPTLSAVFIILAGANGGPFGVDRFLGLKPLVKLGGLSYGLYLWHWPVLAFYFILSDKDSVPLLDGTVIVMVSIVLSYLTTRFIEKPIRSMKLNGPKWKVSGAVIGCMLPVLLVAGIWSITIDQRNKELAEAIENPDYPGAMSFFAKGGKVSADVPVLPMPLQAKDDLPKVYGDGCHQNLEDAEVLECEYGVMDNPDYTIAIVGGSHSAQWLPALEKIAETERIKIINYTKSSCRFTADDDVAESCREWNESLMNILLSTPPDLVFTTADVGSKPDVPPGFVEQWDRLDEAGIPVFAIRDNAWFDFDVPSCVEEHGEDSLKCAKERQVALPDDGPFTKLVDIPDNVYYADLSDYLCDEDYCRPVVGNVLVYRDKHHITSTYVKTMTPVLKEQLSNVLPLSD